MIKGINQNFSPEGIPEGFAYFTKNQVINEKLNEVFNEKGTEVIEAFISAGVETIHGVITFGGKVIIFSTGVVPEGQLLLELPLSFYLSMTLPVRGQTRLTIDKSEAEAFLVIPPSITYQSDLVYIAVPFTIGATMKIEVEITNIGVTGELLIFGNFVQFTGLRGASNSFTNIEDLPPDPEGNPRQKYTAEVIVPIGAFYYGIYLTGTSIIGGTTEINKITYTSAGVLINGNHIGVYDEDTNLYTNKITRVDFGFTAEHAITGKAKLNSRGDLIVAFTDKNVPPKYVNLDTARVSDSLKLYNLGLVGSNPVIDISAVESAGSFKTGAYLASIQYLDRTKATAGWSTLSKVLYIVDHNLREPYANVQGGPSGVVSNKAIRLNLSNLDTSFEALRVTIISRINGVTEAKVYKEITLKGSSLEVTVTGGELTTPITIETVLTHNQIYTKVGELESLADQLFLADVETTPTTDFQKLINKLKVRWTSTPNYEIFSETTTKINKDGNFKTFLHEEVYALYAQIELPDGQLTDWFHIPGPKLPVGSGNSTIANGVKVAGVTPKKFQIEEVFPTGEVTTVEGVIDDFGYTNGYIHGPMACWENADETYPTSFPDFGGEKVRHHKFPSTNYLKANHYTSLATTFDYLKTMWDSLGLKITLDPNDVTSEFLGKYKNIRIGYAKRDINNMTVIGYDIVQLFGYNTFVPGYTGLGGNWNLEAVGSNNDFTITNKTMLRMHSPDLFILRPSVSDLYLKNLLKHTIYYDLDTAYPTGGRYFTGSNLSSTGLDLDVYIYISNFILPKGIPTTSVIADVDRFIKLTEGRYVAANSSVDVPSGHLNNLLNEEFIYFKSEKNLTLNVSGGGVVGNAFQVEIGETKTSPDLVEETLLSIIKAPKANLFTNYTEQQVVPIGSFSDKAETTGIIVNGEGDGFICKHSFITAASAPANDQPYNFTDGDGIRCVKVFACESHFNLNQRYQTDQDVSTYFYPQVLNTAPVSDREVYNSWIASLNQNSLNINKIQYSKDFNALNDLEQFGVYDHSKTYSYQFPDAIARSLKSRRDNDLDDGWRQFRPNDIFYTIRDKGRIINLQAWGTDSLLIHHQQALLKTRDKAVLQTDITTISLGSGDLFTLEPKEVAPSKDGYGGTQHKFSCILTESGYCFVDADTGEIFIHKGEDNYVPIAKGLRLFLQEVFRANKVNDNPFNDTGIMLSFDKEYNRLILSLKANSIFSFTASFDLIKEEWAGLHDYKPDYIFNTRKKLYSFKDKILFKHNTGPRGNYYGVVYPSFTDVVVNDAPSKEKILGAIAWISRVEKEGVNKADETITSITVWNDYFCTGKIDVAPRINLSEYESKNARQVDRGWNFDQIFDVVKTPGDSFVDNINNDYRPISSNLNTELAWFEKEPVRGKYFIIRLEYSNIEDKLVSLRSVIPEIKPSYQ